jgi:hypothetical protein
MGSRVGIPKGFATLCLLGIGFGFGFGWTLGGPSVAQGPPKRHARVTQASIGATALFATKVEKMGAGARNREIEQRAWRKLPEPKRPTRIGPRLPRLPRPA